MPTANRIRLRLRTGLAALLMAAPQAGTLAAAVDQLPEAPVKPPALVIAPPPEATPPPANLPQVLYDLSLLPEPVARLRQEIVDAARSGDIEALRPVLKANGAAPVFSFGDDTDAIGFWKEVSGDGEGREILAIMIEVFEAGFVRVQREGEGEIYVWPYFAEMPLSSLTPAQQVELYELVTAQDVRDMEEFGAYIFYRAGITPDGQWRYFVAGD